MYAYAAKVRAATSIVTTLCAPCEALNVARAREAERSQPWQHTAAAQETLGGGPLLLLTV